MTTLRRTGTCPVAWLASRMADLQEAITTGLHNAYSETADVETGALLGEWVLTAETYGDDGEPYLHTIRSSGMTAWKALGMLEAHAGDLRKAMTEEATDD